ncbi:MAG: RNA polymerase sigma factor [Pirellulales bacterium]
MSERALQAELIDLVAAHQAELYRYAYRLSGSQADAEDLTQQTFLVAQAKLGQVREQDCRRAWLFAVLRNAWLKSRRRPQPTLDAGDLLDRLPGPETGDDPLDRERLQAALNELPDEFKLVLLMFYFEGCSYQEIAQRLAIPSGTVMSRLSRAKGHLRARLLEADVAARRPLRLAAQTGT